MWSFCCLFRLLSQSTRQASTSSETSGATMAKIIAVDICLRGPSSSRAFAVAADARVVGRGLAKHVIGRTIEDALGVGSVGVTAELPPRSSGVV